MYLFYWIKESISTIPIIITNWHSWTSYYYLYLRYFPYLINSNTEKYYCQLLIFHILWKGRVLILRNSCVCWDSNCWSKTSVANQQYADFSELKQSISQHQVPGICVFGFWENRKRICLELLFPAQSYYLNCKL